MGGSVMASIINATTTGITVTGDNSGQLTLSANGSTALTANTTGYLNFAKQPTIGGVEWPAFSAYRSGTQNITTATWTKVQLNSEDFDTASCFDSTTNYRFTPTVAGYYQINGAVHLSNTTDPILQTRVAIYKNGTSYRYANVNMVYPTYYTINDATLQVSALINMNGSSDYLELYCYEYASGTPQIVDTISTCLNGTLVRAS